MTQETTPPAASAPAVLDAGAVEALNAALTAAADLQDWRAAGSAMAKAVGIGWQQFAALAPRSQRDAATTAAADALRSRLVGAVRRYCRDQGPALFAAAERRLAGAPRLEALAEAVAVLLPGLFPSRAELAREARALQKDKDGLELLQGALFTEWLEDPRIGARLIAAMQHPLPDSPQRLAELQARGSLTWRRVALRVEGRLGTIEFRHPSTLNAEDESSLPELEQAVDLMLLHPAVQMGVLRGGAVDHARHAGRRLFSAGINLTALYRGEQSYLWYLVRELGALNKIYRGLLLEPGVPGDESGSSEIPWIAVVDGFAIGGGCQMLLVVDHVLAEEGAYFNLPARKEGIIPGCANLRLPAFLGLRAAQSAILFGREFRVDEEAARGLINAVHPTASLDQAVQRTAALALDSGMVSAAGNRRALRCVGESPDDFRRYMATYAWEQAWCHLSPQLAANLERHWTKIRPRGQG